MKENRCDRLFWLDTFNLPNQNHEEYSYLKNGYLFHDINEYINFTNTNDEEEIEV